ncbi:MAG: hypothetical protein Q4C33_00020 [bacterium]|nr:hypothetical protein [bacterium]
MREAIGGTWLFSIVIVFIVLFTSFLAISVNYSKAFKVKNGIINIIEKREGMSQDTADEISEYLGTVGYLIYSSCPDYTSQSDNGSTQGKAQGFERSNTNANKYKYCVARTEDSNGNIKKTYYKVTVFFRVDLPIMGELFTFPVTGETKPIYFPKNDVF